MSLYPAPVRAAAICAAVTALPSGTSTPATVIDELASWALLTVPESSPRAGMCEASIFCAPEVARASHMASMSSPPVPPCPASGSEPREERKVGLQKPRLPVTWTSPLSSTSKRAHILSQRARCASEGMVTDKAVEPSNFTAVPPSYDMVRA